MQSGSGRLGPVDRCADICKVERDPRQHILAVVAHRGTYRALTHPEALARLRAIFVDAGEGEADE